MTNCTQMIIGVDLGGTNIRAGVINDGAIISLNQALLVEKESQHKTISQLISVIAPLITPEVIGIGIGVPSVVDVENGIVYDVVNIPSWKKVELRKILEAEFNIPVTINNDVNCFALAEHFYGEAKSFSSFVALALGTGIGAGIIINNSLYNGSNCGAGEIGSLPYLDKNFEYYTSSAFFESEHSTTALKAYETAMAGNKTALDIWTQYGFHLGNVIKAVVYTYDPEAIVLGGSISKAYSFFEKSMKISMADFQFPETILKLKIMKTQIENIALLGAAALVR
ncbi:MAG: ROK family protein [Bacteroidales bacterium]|nr:ROK family protein [Bacteroidales bacterium]